MFGGMPEWPKGADCKSAGLCLRWFESTSLHHLPSERAHPTAAPAPEANEGDLTRCEERHAGVAQLAELQPSKSDIGDSSRLATLAPEALAFEANEGDLTRC